MQSLYLLSAKLESFAHSLHSSRIGCPFLAFSGPSRYDLVANLVSCYGYSYAVLFVSSWVVIFVQKVAVVVSSILVSLYLSLHLL